MTTNSIKEVEISINRLLDSLHQFPSNPCIRKVPENFSKLSTCYEPSIVSIGPLHYNTKPTLNSFHEMKARHLQWFLEVGDIQYDLGEYIGIVREQEDKIRSYYSKKSNLICNEFIEMVLIDVAFIIIFFMFYNRDKFPIVLHPMVNRIEVLLMVKQDLFVVENQLPFFILNDLYDKAFGKVYPNTTFKDLTCVFLSCSSFTGTEALDTTTCMERIRIASNIKHLVDLLRICCLPSILRDNDDDPNFSTFNEFPKLTVKELIAAGVEFRTSESGNLLDITFSKGVLQIPKLIVNDTTEVVFRNIMFFEQCHYFHDSYIIDFLIFIDDLIDTPEDVQILVQNGIMVNNLGSDEEVATLFNKITKDVSINASKFYYAYQSKELNAYADARCNKWKAILKQEYFNHPWSVISLIYLLVLLILTVLQVYTGFKG